MPAPVMTERLKKAANQLTSSPRTSRTVMNTA